MNLKKILIVFITSFSAVHGTWSSPPVDVSLDRGSSSPQIGLDDAGRATTVWLKNSGEGETPLTIKSSSWDGFTWSAADEISAPTAEFGLFSPKLAVAKVIPLSGTTAFALWTRSDGINFIVQGSRLISGSWTDAENLSASGGNAGTSQISTNLSGDVAVAVWNRRNGVKNVIQARVWKDGRWQAVTDLSDDTQDAADAQVSVDAEGRAIAVWERFDGSRFIIQSRVWNGIEWLPVQNVSPTGLNLDAIFPQVGLDEEGNAIAVWALGTEDSFTIQGSTYDGASWSEPKTVSEVGENVTGPQLGVDSSGNAVAIWGAKGSSFPVKASVWNGTMWSPPETLSKNDKNTNAQQLSVDTQGNAVAIWEIATEEGRIIQTSIWNQSFWSEPVKISAADSDYNFGPQVSLNSSNAATAIWSFTQGVQSSFNTKLLPLLP